MKPHPYTPDGPRWDQLREMELIDLYGKWEDVPNDLRYAECTCGKSWRVHIR